MTQAAISHQIKTLEEWLGLKLFRRMNRRQLLTDEGQAYMAPIRDALYSIATATDRLKRSETEGLLTASAMTSFAANWLLPRLDQFSRLHLEIDIRVDVRDDLTDFSRDGVDFTLL